MALTVEPATLRDTSYVLYNLNPKDEEETACQIDPGIKRSELAWGLLQSGDTFAVRDDGNPIAVFGTAPLNRYALSVWALGTHRMPKALTAIGRYLLNEHLPAKVAEGYVAMEARSHAGHEDAHRWLEYWGAQRWGLPFPFGRDRDMFLLFRWSADDLPTIAERRRRAA